MKFVKSFSELLAIRKQPMSPEAARIFLQLTFAPGARRRVRTLSAKASEGTLSSTEASELDDWIEAADVLGILHSRARQTLKRKARAA